MQGMNDLATHKIALTTTSETYRVRICDIMYCISSNSYTTFYLQYGQKQIVTRSIRYYEGLLTSYGFIRTHPSYLVNKEYVQRISRKEGISLILQDGAIIPVSKNKKTEVMAQLI
ncbi:MAG: response regulator transcription factor [Chitinophagaceae bacterium]|nr:response regulator transcription factor [Chitinophagaceae bacterium]